MTVGGLINVKTSLISDSSEEIVTYLGIGRGRESRIRYIEGEVVGVITRLVRIKRRRLLSRVPRAESLRFF